MILHELQGLIIKSLNLSDAFISLYLIFIYVHVAINYLVNGYYNNLLEKVELNFGWFSIRSIVIVRCQIVRLSLSDYNLHII